MSIFNHILCTSSDSKKFHFQRYRPSHSVIFFYQNHDFLLELPKNIYKYHVIKINVRDAYSNHITTKCREI